MDESDTSSVSNISLTYEDYLKLATDQQLSIVLELDLDGNIQYISKQWLDMVSSPDGILPLGKPIKSLIKGSGNDKLVFNRVMEMMLNNDNVSYIVTFTTWDDQIMEASGILILNDNKLPTHSMWIVKPFVDIEYDNLITGNEQNDRFYTLNDPQFWKKLGYGATYLNDYLNQIIDNKITNEIDLPRPRMELCNNLVLYVEFPYI